MKDLFGNTIFEKSTGKQQTLFPPEPESRAVVSANEPIKASKNAVDPAHTAPLPFKPLVPSAKPKNFREARRLIGNAPDAHLLTLSGMMRTLNA